MGRHPEYRDAPVCSFEQGLEEIEALTYSSVVSDRQDPEFDLEMEEIARREWPVSPIVVIVPAAITIAVTLGLFFGIPAVFAGLGSKQPSNTSPSSNSISVVSSTPSQSQNSVEEQTANVVEVKPVETVAGTTWSETGAGANRVPTDMKFAFFKDGTGKIETGGKNTLFIWEENKETHTVNAYGSATGAVAIPNGSNLDFKSATFDIDGVNLVMTSWEDSSGTSNLNVVFVQ